MPAPSRKRTRAARPGFRRAQTPGRRAPERRRPSPRTPRAGTSRASRIGARRFGTRRETARSRRGSLASAPPGASGGRSMGPACASAAARIATVPPLTANVSSDPPSMTRPNEAPNAINAAGLARSAPNTDATIWRVSPAMISSTSAPSSSTTRTMPPTTGTASSSFSVPSAMNCTATRGQFAAATNAPRFREAFRSGG